MVIHWAKGDLVVPVSSTIPAPPAPILPSASGLVNAAHPWLYPQASLAPGEIMSLFGQNLATTTSDLRLDSAGNLSRELNGTFVLVGGLAAPLLYASPTQVNLVVPYEIENAASATVQILTPFGNTPVYSYPVATSAPAIFSADSTGTGQASVLNQNGAPNSVTNPASRGSVVQIFATGEGQTSPPGITGSITGNNPSTPILPVSVIIGGVNAPVMFAGAAPGQVAGLSQINVVVPTGAPVGARVPIVLTVGAVQSQSGTTIAIE